MSKKFYPLGLTDRVEVFLKFPEGNNIVQLCARVPNGSAFTVLSIGNRGLCLYAGLPNELGFPVSENGYIMMHGQGGEQ